MCSCPTLLLLPAAHQVINTLPRPRRREIIMAVRGSGWNSVALDEISMHADLKALLSGGGNITDFFRRPTEDDADGAGSADE